MPMDLDCFKRSFSEPVERLQNLFFQILLFESNRYAFSKSDWSDFAQAYGQLFFTYESLWTTKTHKFEQYSRAEIQFYLDANPLENSEATFVQAYQDTSRIFDSINYDLNESYPDIFKLNLVSEESNINIPVTDIFTAIKGGFRVRDHIPGFWAYNAIDIEAEQRQLNKSFTQLLEQYIEFDITNHLSSFLAYREEEHFTFKQKVNGEKEAVRKELAQYPDLLEWHIDRIIFIIRLSYCKKDGSELSPETIRRTVNRMKSNGRS